MSEAHYRLGSSVLIALGLVSCWAFEELAPLEATTDGGQSMDAEVEEGTDAGDCPPEEVYYRDDDDDGSGRDGVTRCGSSGPFTARVGGDCDDTVAEVNPASAEVCNGIDDDCDGEVDEDVRNVCGGCGDVPVRLGAGCGVPECSWACVISVPGAVCSAAGGTERCGACSTWKLDEPCGVCGQTACAPEVEEPFVVCVDPGLNACGGCEPLTIKPGEPCGDGIAVYECHGKNAVECPK